MIIYPFFNKNGTIISMVFLPFSGDTTEGSQLLTVILVKTLQAEKAATLTLSCKIKG